MIDLVIDGCESGNRRETRICLTFLVVCLTDTDKDKINTTYNNEIERRKPDTKKHSLFISVQG